MAERRLLPIGFGLLIASVVAAPVAAQNHGAALAGFTATCGIRRGGDQVTIEIRASNGSAVDLTGLTALGLTVNTTDSAALDIVTTPVPRRVLIRNNSHTFRWQGDLSGAGTITVTGEVTAETPDGQTVTTGPVTCDSLTLTVSPTNTPRVPPTLGPTNTPRSTSTPRPTQTPRLEPTEKPTRTPRPTLTPRTEQTERPTRTARPDRPTNTPRPGRPTNTPRPERPTNTPRPERTARQLHATHTPVPARPTRTAVPPTEPPAVDRGALTSSCFAFANGTDVTVTLVINNGVGIEIDDLTPGDPQISSTGTAVLALGPSSPSGFSKVPDGATARFRWRGQHSGDGKSTVVVSAHALASGEIVETQATCDPLSSSEAPPPTPTATRTLRIANPTRTPVPPLPTRTPQQPQDTRTPRPTAAIDAGGFTATCHTFQNNDSVTVVLSVHNGTGAPIDDVLPQGPTVVGSGSVSLNTGPSPSSYSAVGDGAKATFRWTGRLTSVGDAAFSASATATGQGGVPLSTGEIDCGTANLEAPPAQPFDPTQLLGQCTARAVDGPIILSFRLDVFNATGDELTNVEASLVSIETTGSVDVVTTAGPNPSHHAALRADRRATFKWQGHATGRGNAFVHVTATAVGQNGEPVSTGVIECSTLVIPPRP